MSDNPQPEDGTAASAAVPEQRADEQPAATEKAKEDFLAFLARYGELCDELTEALATVIGEVQETTNAGAITLKLKFSWAPGDSFGGRLVVDDDVDVKHPKVNRETRAKYWLGEGGELLDYPPIPKNQTALPFGGGQL
jgi:hypothetical protein